MALDHAAALLEVLEVMKAAEVDDRVRAAAETIYQALIEAELTAVIGAGLGAQCRAHRSAQRVSAEAPSPETPRPDASEAAAAEAPRALATEARQRPRLVNGRRAGLAPSADAAGSRSDAELVAELHRMGDPLAVRKVQRLLGVGWPRAKRLTDMAGWTDRPTATTNSQQANGNRPGDAAKTKQAETEPTDHAEARTNP